MIHYDTKDIHMSVYIVQGHILEHNIESEKI